jgi:hypothetical protein
MNRSILTAKLRSILPVRTMVMLGMVLCFSGAMSQTLPVNQMDLDGDLRNLQLKGILDPAYSFTARPFFQQGAGKSKKNISENDTIDFAKRIDPATRFLSHRYLYRNEKIAVALQPFMFTTKFNSHHPYGWNDEAMIAAKGLQTELSTGVYAQIGPLSIQLQPQFVYTANPQYDTGSAYGSGCQ